MSKKSVLAEQPWASSVKEPAFSVNNGISESFSPAARNPWPCDPCKFTSKRCNMSPPYTAQGCERCSSLKKTCVRSGKGGSHQQSERQARIAEGKSQVQQTIVTGAAHRQLEPNVQFEGSRFDGFAAHASLRGQVTPPARMQLAAPEHVATYATAPTNYPVHMNFSSHSGFPAHSNFSEQTNSAAHTDFPARADYAATNDVASYSGYSPIACPNFAANTTFSAINDTAVDDGYNPVAYASFAEGNNFTGREYHDNIEFMPNTPTEFLAYGNHTNAMYPGSDYTATYHNSGIYRDN